MKLRFACFLLTMNFVAGCGPAPSVIPTDALTEEQKAAIKAEDDAVAMEESQGSVAKTKRRKSSSLLQTVLHSSPARTTFSNQGHAHAPCQILVASMFIGLIACGCNPSSPARPLTTTQPVSASAPSGPEVPYPQFENWNQFAVGTQIVRRKEVTNPNGYVYETETLKLIEKSDKKVVVESQTLVERSTGVNDDNPAQQFTFPATFKLPASMTIEQFKLPSLKAELKAKSRSKSLVRLITPKSTNGSKPMKRPDDRPPVMG